MTYELYTWPHCEDCDKVKKLLEERGIQYSARELFENTEAKRQLGDAQAKSKRKIERDLRGRMIFPILVGRNGDGVESLIQGYENIRKSLT